VSWLFSNLMIFICVYGDYHFYTFLIGCFQRSFDL
jgi:hypothetical protein